MTASGDYASTLAGVDGSWFGWLLVALLMAAAFAPYVKEAWEKHAERQPRPAVEPIHLTDVDTDGEVKQHLCLRCYRITAPAPGMPCTDCLNPTEMQQFIERMREELRGPYDQEQP